MEKEKFRKLYEEAPVTVDGNRKTKEEIRTLDTTPVYIGHGTRNLIIVMEELAELQEQLVLQSIGTGEKICLIEETADVYMAMDYVRMICNITESEIQEQDMAVSLYINPLHIIGTLVRLQQKLSKYLRGKIDDTGLVKEVADVLTAIEMIKKKYHISDEEINKAVNVKLQRLEETKDIYQ